MKPTTKLRAVVQWAGLFAGPAMAVFCYVMLPERYDDAGVGAVAFTSAGRVTLSVMVWMACWWLTEAIDISATALLPLVLLPLFGAAAMDEAAAPYAHPLIFLFMGGFLIALSMSRWGLDRRLALGTLRLVGTKPANMVGGFMLATAGLSAFVSNTATAAIMLPIATSVIRLVRRGAGENAEGVSGEPEKLGANFALCLLLGIAYAASVGGISTIVGTPPNAFLVGFVRSTIAPEYQMEISFARWLMLGLPFSLVFLPIIWLLLTRVIFPIRVKRIEGGDTLIQAEWEALGKTNRGEWATLAVFLCVAATWITRPLLTRISVVLSGETYHPFEGLSDANVAMAGALVLFVLPLDLRKRKFVMDWQTAGQLPWGILVLFGGGLSLAAAVQANGVAQFIGSRAGYFREFPPIFTVIAVTTTVIFLTELTSNIATTATLLPVLAALAPGLGLHPYVLIFPAAIAASCAFMMPVATPPNAIIFGSGEVTIPEMARAGWWLNVIGILLVTVLAMLMLEPVLGLDLGL